MENGQDEPAPIDNLAEAVFSNHLILAEILGSSTTQDTRSWRLVNKLFNAIASDALSAQQNTVKFFQESHAVTTFLDVMKSRLEYRIPYSASYKLGLSWISSDVLRRFGSDLKNQVRKLDLKLLCWYYRRQIRGGAPYEGKDKALMLLSLFPNITELHLNYAQNDRVNTLNSEDLAILPSEFRHLQTFKTSYTRMIFGTEGEPHDSYPIPSDFTTAIFKRSPNLKRIEVGSCGLYPSLQSIPDILSKFSSPPALSFRPVLRLAGSGNFDADIVFLRSLRNIGFHNLRMIQVSLESPTPSVMTEFNGFLEFQANHTLESLTLFGFGSLDPSMNLPLTLPVMPKLNDFSMHLTEWPLTQVHPYPLTKAYFPLFEFLNFQNEISGIPFETSVRGGLLYPLYPIEN